MTEKQDKVGSPKPLEMMAKHYLQGSFVVCAMLLGLAAAGMSVVINRLEIHLTKEPLPIRRTLSDLDYGNRGTLGPYRIVRKVQIENREILDSLGTEEYIQWVLEDPAEPDNSMTKYANLFITYYDMPDRVPHVPEECYTGSGHQQLGADSIAMDLSGDGQADQQARYLRFSNVQSQALQQSEFAVMYLISVDGRYAANREEARFLLNQNIFSRQSYFSKVEWRFMAGPYAPNMAADQAEYAAASQRLMRHVLPLLENEHWPAMNEDN